MQFLNKFTTVITLLLPALIGTYFNETPFHDFTIFIIIYLLDPPRSISFSSIGFMMLDRNF